MWFPLAALWRSMGSRTPPRRKPAYTRLTVEALEDRTVPSFLAPVTSVGGGVRLAVGDFNHDGLDDVVALGGTLVRSSPTSDPTMTGDVVAVNGTVTIYLSKGDGTFLQPLILGGAQGAYLDPKGYFMDSFSDSFSVRDVNGDGHLDVTLSTMAGPLATSTKKSKTTTTTPGVSTPYTTTGYENVWLGTGDGTFGAVSVTAYATATWYMPPWCYYFHTAFADFNHDGVDDRATVDGKSSVVSVSLGNHNGTYQTAVTYATGPNPGVVAVGDFNGDGWADLITTNGTSSGTPTFSVSLNNGIWPRTR